MYVEVGEQSLRSENNRVTELQKEIMTTRHAPSCHHDRDTYVLFRGVWQGSIRGGIAHRRPLIQFVWADLDLQ